MHKEAVVVLGDQLHYGGLAQRCALENAIPIIMSESVREIVRVPSSFHRAHYFLSAMRTFAGQCAAMGITVYYQCIDGQLYQLGEHEGNMVPPTDTIDALLSKAKEGGYANVESFFDGKKSVKAVEDEGLWENLKAICIHFGVEDLYAYEPSEKGSQRALKALGIGYKSLGFCGFIESPSVFANFSAGKVSIKMEHFYRFLRRRHKVLMQKDGVPMGGDWNFDEQNRSAYPKAGPPASEPIGFIEFTPLMRAVQKDLKQYAGLCSPLEHPVCNPVDRAGALAFFEDFVRKRLSLFGQYQDAMHKQSPFGFHALIGAYLNSALLEPLEVCARVQQAYEQGACSISSAEGFIRQVLGWREYMHGLYELEYDHMQSANQWGALRDLPSWFYAGYSNSGAKQIGSQGEGNLAEKENDGSAFAAENKGLKSVPTAHALLAKIPVVQSGTKMNCLKRVISNSWFHGYAHHIERLMVVGSFCTVAGIDPKQVSFWFDGVYQDALEWVQLPNVRLMALNCSDKGYTSKPYICSGGYLQKQGNDCKGCAYDPKQSTGERACPMSTLYWHFIGTHKEKLAKNARMSMMVNVYEKMGSEKQEQIKSKAKQMLSNLNAL